MSSFVGKTIGDYQILLEVSATAASTVYKAHHIRLGRDVAVQVILPSQARPAGLFPRLKEHAKTLAKLSHPSIGTLLDCAMYKEDIYLVYDFVPRDILRRRFNIRMTWKQAAGTLAPVAQALVYAHQMGIVHGSIRPSSIFITEEGFPVLFDFGIDNIIMDELRKEIPGHWIDSEINSFSAPERTLDLSCDQRTDIYSLGMVLFELVMGRRAFQCETPIEEITRQYAHACPDFGKEAKMLPPLAIQILKKALAVNPQDRFQEMQHLSILLTKSALNQRVSRHIVKDINWQPAVASARAVIGPLVLLLTLGVLVSVFANRLLDKPETVSQSEPPAIMVMMGSPTASPAAKASPPPASTPAITAEMVATNTAIAAPPRLVELPVLFNTPVPKGGDPIVAANAARLLPVAQMGIGWLNEAAWSPDGTQFYAGTSTGVFRIDRQTQAVTQYFNTAGSVACLAVSPDGRYLATGDSDGLVRLWDAQNGSEITAFAGHTARINELAFTPGSDMLASASDDRTIRIWDIQSLHQVGLFEGHSAEVKSIALSTEGRWLASGGMDARLIVWDLTSGIQQVDVAASHRIVGVKHGAGGTWITAGHDYTLLQWDAQGKLTNRVGRITNPIVDLDVSPDGRFIAASNAIGGLYVWSQDGELLLERKNERIPRAAGSDSIYHHRVFFSPDSKWVTSALWDNTIRYWILETGEEAGNITAYTNFIGRLAVSPDSRYLAAQTLDRVVKVWDLPRNRLLYELPGEILPGRVFSYDNHYLALKQNNNSLKIYQLSNRAEVVEFGGHSNLQSVSFSSTRRSLVTSDGSRLRLWSLASKQELVVVPGYGFSGCSIVSDQSDLSIAFLTRLGYADFVNSGAVKSCTVMKTGWMQTVTFNNNGSMAAAGGPSKLQIWDYTKDLSPRLDLEGISGLQIDQIAISPDDLLVAVALSDGTIRIWSVETKKEIVRVSRQKERITALMFSPDGRYLISSSLDGTVLVWGIQ
jgi:WD40 repeat protein/serine/threonine protein kinase